MLLLHILVAALACHQAVEGRATIGNFFQWVKSLSVDPKLMLPYIVNGMESPEHMFNYQVALTIYDEFGRKGGLCGGSLITRDWVLTAAHCLQMPGGPKFGHADVILGAHWRSRAEPNQQRIKTSQGIMHPNFLQAPPSYDIALLKLERPAELNYYVNTVKLPKDDSETYEGYPVRVSGWGVTEHGFTSMVLRFVETQVMKDDVCIKELGNGYSSTNICSSGIGNKGTAPGDSGGPMTAYDPKDGSPFVIGVCSYGHRQGSIAGKPTAFTRVTKLLPWIKEHVKEL